MKTGTTIRAPGDDQQGTVVQRVLARVIGAVSHLPPVLIGLLLFVAPLAYEGVTPGGALIVEVGLAVLVLAWAATRLAAPMTAPIGYGGLVIALFALAFLILLQLVPLPATLASNLSTIAHDTTRLTWPLLAPSYRPDVLPLSAVPAETLHGLLRYVLAVGLVFVVRDLYRAVRPRHGLIHVMLAAGIVQVLVGIVHMVGHASTIYFQPGGLPAEPHFFGSFVSQNRNAAYLNLLWPVALAMGVEQWLAGRPRTGTPGIPRPPLKPDRSLLEAPAYVATAVVLAAGVLLCNSRMGWLILLWSLVTLGTLFWARCGRPLRAWSAWLSTMVLGGLAAWTFRDTLIVLLSRLSEKQHPHLRPLIWASALEAARDNPWFGTGLNTFKNAFARYNPIRGYYTVLHADNTYLDLLVELGVPGALLVLATVVLVGYRVSTSRFWEGSRGQGAILGHCVAMGGLLIHSVVEHTTRGYGVLIPAAVTLGLLLAAVRSPDARHFDTALRYGRTPARTLVPLALMPVAAALALAMNLADGVTERARQAYQDGRLPSLTRSVLLAAHLVPWASGPWQLLGTTELMAAHHLLTRSFDETPAVARATLEQVPGHLRNAERYLTAAVLRDPLGGYAQRALSRLAQLRGERGLALALAKDACRVQPRDYRNHLQLARILEWMGNKDGALDEYGEAMVSAPDTTLDWMAEAMFKAADGNPDVVAAHLPDTDDWRPILAIGMIIAHTAAFEEAVPWLRRVIALRPARPTPVAEIGYLALERGADALAEDAAQYLRTRFPDYHGGYGIEARILARQGKTDEAVATMFEAVARRKPSVEEELWIVRLLAESGQRERAYTLLQEMQGRYPGEVRIPVVRAQLLWKEGRHSDACEALRTAIDIRPSLEEPRYLLWQFHKLLGGPELRAEAEKDLEACAALPYAPRCRFQLALQALANKQVDKAVRLLEEAVAQDGSRPVFWRALAKARMEAGDRSGAAEALERAVALDPENPENEAIETALGW